MFSRKDRVYMLVFISFCLFAALAFSDQPQEPSSNQYQGSGKIQHNQIELTEGEKAFLQSHSVIQLGTDETWEPFVSRGTDGILRGVDVDFIRYINESTGSNIQLVTGQWADMVKKAKNREIDGLVTSAPLKAREPYFNFSDVYVSEFMIVIIPFDSPLKIKNLSDLSGKTVAIQKGNEAYAALLKPYPSIKVMEAVSDIESAKMVVEGKADACISGTSSYKVIHRNFLQSIKIGYVASEKPLDLVFSIRKDWPKLVTIINKSLASIPQETINGIYLRWFGMNPPEPSIQGKPPIQTTIVDNYYPYTFVNESGEPDGFSVDLIKAAAQIMGLELQINIDLWEKARDGLKTGKIDFLPMMAYSEERDKEFDFSAPHTIAFDAFFTRKTSPKVRSLKDLSQKKIIVMRGDQAHDYLRSLDYISDDNLILIDDLQDALRMLASGEGDAALMPKLVGLTSIEKLGLTNLELAPIVVEAYKRPFSVAVKEGNQELLERLNQGLKIVKETHQRQEIYEKWFGVHESPRISFTDVLKYLLWFILAFILFGSALFFWSLSLKRQVAIRTKDLEEEIDERKRAEEALRESEDKFRSFAEQSLVGIYLISGDLFKYVNPKFAEIFGYSVDECLDNMHFPQLVHPEDLATVQKQVGRRLSGETKAVRYSFRGIKKSGETIHVEIFGSSMLLKGKSVATGTMLDITESKRAEASLQREKGNLSTILDNNPNGIVLFDNNGKWIYANPMFTEITGYTPEDIQTGRQWFRKAYPDAGYRKKVIGAWKKDSKQAGRGDNYEFNVTCKDGQVKQIEFRATHLADRSVSVLTDVTHRKKIEESLYEAKLFLDNISDLAYMADSEGHVIYANPAAERITGLALSEIIDRPLLPLIVEKDRNLLIEVYNRTLAGESLENIVTFNSGITCHFTSLPFKDNYGNIIGTFGIARDISDRLDAEEALKESEGRLKKAQSVAKLGNWEYDISTRKIWGSEQAFRIYGIERTSPYLPLDRVEACIPDAPRVSQALIDLLQENKKYDLEFEVQQEVSRQTILIHSIAELVYENGMPVKVLGVIQDVTEQKKAEKERKDLEDQLQHAQKMEAIGTLAGGVAHDLNNILGGLVSYPELLLLQLPEDSPLRKSILTIQKSGEKAAAVVQDLLTLARRGVVVTEVVNPNDVIAEYLKSPEHENLQSYHPGVHIETHLEKDVLNILGSSTHLSKTVMNLVSNAAEAMPDGGKLTVSTENRYIDRPIRGYDDVKEGDYVVLTISDTGTGISPDDMEKIFEPFYTKKKMGRSGTGLGMAVVWGTVKDHNGYIHVQSTERKGTTFTLYFPVTRKSLEERSEISLKNYIGKGEAILVVDDVEEQRKIASGMLKELGYSVVSVSSGEEAVEYLKTNKVDLLVLDMIMDPGMDGLETYKKILQIRPGQKAIIASGFSETDRVSEAQSLGAGAYIRKPLLLEKIGLAVKEELEP